MKVNICGIPHTVIECPDNFDVDAHLGQIDYKACEIRINKNMTDESKKETICHEMVHGILVQLGYSDQSQDEQFVQALANAIYQGFDIRGERERMTSEEIIADERYHNCGRCKWEDIPYICNQCKWGEDTRKDLWEPKEDVKEER